MDLEHFSHPHPLVFISDAPARRKDGDEDDKFACVCCEKPILSSAYYGCIKCNYFLHKKCGELPRVIKHPSHYRVPPHPLTLRPHPLIEGSHYCNLCYRWGSGFVYRCSLCKFNAHVLCVNKPDEKKLAIIKDYKNVHDHPLTFVKRVSLFMCDACGIEAEDLSYLCSTCQFWIHADCASSATTTQRRDHKHPLVLASFIPYRYQNFFHDCYICQKAVHQSIWVYYCSSCRYFAHLNCAKSKEKPTVSSENVDRNLVCVPVPGLLNTMTQFSIDTSLIYDAKYRIPCPNDHIGALVHDGEDRKNEMMKKEVLCDMCVQPISFSSPFSNCAECSFIAHTRCTLVKIQIQHPSHPQHPLTLSDSGSTFVIRRCDICGVYTNGFFFYCNTCTNFTIDVSCATTFLPSKIKHDAHNHLLTLQTVSATHDHLQTCKACGEPILCYGRMKYACDPSIGCDYKLHAHCAMLLGTLEHDWDKHHMSLTFPPFDHPEDYFCETCEEDIHPNHWLYHCSKCDHSFHTNCAHLDDWWSKVMYGITYKFEDHHEHNLTLVRRPKKSGPCEICGDLDRDSPCLDCASCSYQMCYTCGGRASSERIE